jgi:hypothetical protein
MRMLLLDTNIKSGGVARVLGDLLRAPFAGLGTSRRCAASPLARTLTTDVVAALRVRRAP